MAGAQSATEQVAQRGRAGSGANATANASSPPSGDEGIALAEFVRVYDQLGAGPPKIDIARNDLENAQAHTLDRHGSDIPLRRDLSRKTIEGRIYQDTGWGKVENQSFKWDSPTVMTREVNDYVQHNWESIRSDLATDGFHEARFDTGHRIGEGFLNRGMYGFGPRQAEYTPTSLVRLRIRLVPGSDPAQPFIVSAFPAGIL